MNIQIFLSFLKIGLVGFGGGPSMIPLIHDEVVKRRQWVSDDDFSNILAIANTLPGPIATKLPGYIGYKVNGIFGCILGVLAITVPMIFAMVILLGAFNHYQNIVWIRGMGQAVVPVVMIMMLQLTWDFFKKAKSSLGLYVTIPMVVVVGGLIFGLGMHPATIILVLLVVAVITPVTIRSLR